MFAAPSSTFSTLEPQSSSVGAPCLLWTAPMDRPLVWGAELGDDRQRMRPSAAVFASYMHLRRRRPSALDPLAGLHPDPHPPRQWKIPVAASQPRLAGRLRTRSDAVEACSDVIGVEPAHRPSVLLIPTCMCFPTDVNILPPFYPRHHPPSATLSASASDAFLLLLRPTPNPAAVLYIRPSASLLPADVSPSAVKPLVLVLTHCRPDRHRVDDPALATCPPSRGQALCL